jgi:hypothetical protein
MRQIVCRTSSIATKSNSGGCATVRSTISSTARDAL